MRIVHAHALPRMQVTGNGGAVSVTGIIGSGWPAAFYYPCNALGACDWFTPTAVHPVGYAPFVGWTSGNAHPTFERCNFTKNYAAVGAGIWTWEASITMSDCLFDSNQAGQGGAVYSAPHLTAKKLPKGCPASISVVLTKRAIAWPGRGMCPFSNMSIC